MLHAPAETPRDDSTRPAGRAARALALAEVIGAFVLVHLGYRAFKNFTTPGHLETSAGLNYSPGLVMILASFLLILASRRSPAEYGLTLKDWPRHVRLGLAWGLAVALGAALIVVLGRFHPDPRLPRLTSLALIGAGGYLALTAVMLLAMKTRPTNPTNFAGASSPARTAATLALLLIVAALPVFISLYSHKPTAHAALLVGELLVGAGLGEELFFRGYIQSRLNHTFGRPFSLLGTAFGPGLLVSSLLFGAIHTLNTVDYFAGRYEFAWSWGLMNACAGVFLGFMRERTASILPGAVAHAVNDIVQQVPAFMLAL